MQFINNSGKCVLNDIQPNSNAEYRLPAGNHLLKFHFLAFTIVNQTTVHCETIDQTIFHALLRNHQHMPAICLGIAFNRRTSANVGNVSNIPQRKHVST